MRKLLSRRVVWVTGAALLTLFLVRPPAGWLRSRVTQSIAQALGRNAEISSVHLRFLPRPGFALDNLVLHDDPAFGAEPLLRAPEVTAWLRIGSLLRGRIEISSLSLDNASLNLTRDPNGKWNLEDLIERTSHIAMAPTGAGHARQRPAFPYIEAASARINFKAGMEKLHFALTDAEFALWQESDNTWGMRLKANPIRTDANLTDTGALSLNGIWQRAPAAHQTPILISFRWQKAQIGQVSKLIYGVDKGWRGGAAVSGSISGTPDHLMVTADASVDDFRRQDVLGGGTLQLNAHCGAQYESQVRSISNLDCVVPSTGGVVEFKGTASGLRSGQLLFSSYDFWLVADKLPAGLLLALARHVNPRFSADLNADGTLNGAVEITRNGVDQNIRLQGNGTTDQLQLTSSNGAELSLDTVPFRLVADDSAQILHRHTTVHAKKPAVSESNLIPAHLARIEVGPLNLGGGKAAPLLAEVSLSGQGYEAVVRGDSNLKHLFQVAKLFGVPAPALSAVGHAAVDLKIANAWAGVDRPSVEGTARLSAVEAQLRGLNSPIELGSAELLISEEAVTVKNLTASAAGANWTGAMHIPRPCSAPDKCPVQFSLHTPQLSAAGLNKLLNPAMARKSWYGFLSIGSEQRPYLLQARAQGKIAVDKLLLGGSECSHLAATLALDSGKLTLSSFHAEALDGRATGEWSADFTSKPPKYSGRGDLEEVSLAEVADLMHDPWVDGSGSAKYEFTTEGTSLQDIVASADVTAKFAIVNSKFPHVVLNVDSGPLRARDFSGTLSLREGQFSFQDAKLETASGVYTVSGTASLNGALNVKMANENMSGFNITGTFLRTRVATVSTAQASLKP